jgi:signal peptidase I
MFKRGDVVYYRDDTNEVGVVDRPDEHYINRVWVDWVRGADAGLRLHADLKDLRLLPTGQGRDMKTSTEYTVAELKKLLDKMDDNIVFSFSDLKIHFNK